MLFCSEKTGPLNPALKLLGRLLVAGAVLAALSAVPAPADSPDSRRLLLRHYEAVGGYERVKAEKTAYLEGKITHDGLVGRMRQWQMTPLRFRTHEDYTVIRQTYGDDGSRSWSKDANGKVIVKRDADTLKRRRVKKLLQEFDHMDPDSKNFSLSYEGIENVDGIPCHCIRTANSINEDVSLDYIDTRTFMLKKSILRQPDMEFHTRYSDYRAVSGIIHAHREETVILPKEKKITVEIDTYRTHIEVDPALFELPKDDAADFNFTVGDRSENIPFEFVENTIFLPVTIAGDTRLWILDSGATMSVIDRAYAVDLGLQIHSGIRGAGMDGVFQLDFTTLPGYQVPGLRFHPQTAFSLDGLADRFYDPHAFGILGFDLLSRVVTRIDYASGTLSFYDPDAFEYMGPGAIVDAPLKGKTFSLPMTVEGRYGGNWSLDLGSFDVSFHFPFARRHGLYHRRGVNRISADLSGVFQERVAAFAFVELGGFRVDNVLISIPHKMGKGANAGGELTGNIGNSLLHRFVLTLDYHRQQVILEKGRDFHRIIPRDGSGLVIGLSQSNLPMVSFVAPGTPGEASGFLAGDIIQAVDGAPLEAISGAAAVRKLLRSPPGSRYLIDVSRNGSPLRIPILLENLY